MKANLKRKGNDLIRDSTNNALRQQFFILKKKYKTAKVQIRRKFKQNLYSKLETMTEKNPKDYWELFDKLKKLS